MASFTGVGDNVELSVAARGETVDIDISGTYDMTIAFQKEVGSPSSGAWVTLREYSTANATVAETYVTTDFNEKLRLIVLVDTSGTATATLASTSDLTIFTLRDPLGNPVATFRQSGVEFPGALVQGSNAVLTAATTLNPTDHSGRLVVINNTTGFATTLPAATGSGVQYKIAVGTTVSSGSHTIVVTGTDIMQGSLVVATDASGITSVTAADSDTITMNGSTTGGVAGSYVELTDAASGVWIVKGHLVATGAESTPFSAGV